MLQISANFVRVSHGKINASISKALSIYLTNGKRNFTSQLDRAYLHTPGKEPLKYRSLGEQLFMSAEMYGDRTALVSCDENLQYSFKQLKQEAEKLAVNLRDMGLKPEQDHLGIWAPNTSHWYITCLAAALTGLPLVCLNPAYEAAELKYALMKAKVKALVTMDICGRLNFHKTLRTVIDDISETSSQIISNSELPNLRFIISKQKHENETVKAFYDFDDLLKKPVSTAAINAVQGNLPKINPESTCNIQFTSGTTGKPKVALLSHFNLINTSYYSGQILEMQTLQATACCPPPFFHIFGAAVATAALIHGATLVLPSATFNAAACIDAIEKQRCNVVLGTPAMFVDMLQQQRKMKRDISSLELGFTGGSSCSPEMYAEIKKVLGLRTMRLGYGLSETSSVQCCHDGSEDDATACTNVGKMIPHSEIKIVNDNGETVRIGEPGELWTRGFYTMKGYYEDEEKTREIMLPNGWLRTGDEFVLQANKTLRCVGRKTDIIIRGGENIFPKELEDLLDTHESVLEAQAIGVPDKRLGEEVCVYLRLRPGTKALTVDDIKAFCKGKIAYFKIPRYVEIIDEFPKTISGKIQKFKLRELFEESKTR